MSEATTGSPQPAPPARGAGDFESDFRAAMRGVQTAFMELLDAIGADATRPQDISRRFGINRNLAWKLGKIVHASDPTAVFEMLPGSSGLKILLETCRGHGADATLCARTAEARERLDDVARRHAGDRAGLDVLLRARTHGAGAHDAQELSRRQAFLANGSIWGVQARVQLGLQVHVPSVGSPGKVDAASVSGVLGFQRLRPTAAWPLARLQAYAREEEGAIDGRQVRPLDADTPDGAPPLVTTFSSVDAQRLHPVAVPGGTAWELKQGPVGRTGLVDCLFGRRVESIGGQTAEAGSGSAVARLPLCTPVETAQLDLLVHRDLAYADVAPTVELLSLLETAAEGGAGRAYHLHPPCDAVDLGPAPPSLASPHVARLAPLADWMLGRMGHTLDAFRVWRLVIPYPPIPSAPGLRLELPAP